MTIITANSQPKKSLLGITTKFASGSSTEFAIIHNRYRLQSLAAGLLINSRTARCLRSISPLFSDVEVRRSIKNKRAYYGHLQLCGSVWNCPVCASAISERRKIELATALSRSNHQQIMLTYTMKHHKNMPLADTLKAVTDAYRKVHSGRSYQELKTEHGIVGSIRTLEITYGQNGWHPHIHELIFAYHMNAQGILSDVTQDWLSTLRKAGYTASKEHGVDLRHADRFVSEYMSKWGHLPTGEHWSIEHEMTKQPVKKGRRGKSPFELLQDYGNRELPDVQRKKSARLFREYSENMFRKQQLVWSKGLKDELGIDEIKDSELVTDQDIEYDIMAVLMKPLWHIVCRKGERARLLEIASKGDTREVWLYLNELRQRSIPQ